MAGSGEPGKITVGHGKVLPWVFLFLSVANIVLGSMTGDAFNIGFGCLLTVIAILQLSMPYFVLTASDLQIKNLLGMTVRRYAFASLGQFAVSADGKSVRITDEHGLEKKVRLARWMSDRRDWDRFLAILSTQAFE